MKKFLKNKCGVTILEGLIALMLLAMVATGTFAVLLSTSRKATSPDIREEMALAVERVSQLLQVYVYATDSSVDSAVWAEIKKGLCPEDDTTGAPLMPDTEHEINCQLPPICDKNQSSFSYKLTESSENPQSNLLESDKNVSELPITTSPTGLYNVQFSITCNGFTL